MFTKGAITIKWENNQIGGTEDKRVEAFVSDKGIAYHKVPGKETYTLTHVATGRAIVANLPYERIATLAERVESLTDWTATTIEKQVYQQVLQLLHS